MSTFRNEDWPDELERVTAQRDELAAMLRKLLVHAERYSEDCGGCDHSVGICSCDLRNDIEDAHALLGGFDGN